MKALPSVSACPYQWDTVRIGGGGAVTHILFHPYARDVRYLRTDVGNLYRWDDSVQRWVALLDWVSVNEWWLSAAESVALDPNDTSGEIVYAALGKYWDYPGDLVRSFDGGKSWERSNLHIRIGANSNQEKQRGERLAVDPHNSSIVYYASSCDGLWRSVGQGAPQSWQKINPINSTFIILDKSSGAMGYPMHTYIAYVGTPDQGVFRSVDGGLNWEHLTGSPLDTRKAAIDSREVLYVTHTDGVARFDGTRWQDISPEARCKFVAIAIAPQNDHHVLVSRRETAFYQPMYRSLNGGQSWQRLTMRAHHQLRWTPANHFAAATMSLAFDPHHIGSVWFTDWYFAWRTLDISAPTVDWVNVAQGHEDMVTIGALATPPSGPFVLLSSLADNPGFEHRAVSAYPDLPSTWERGMPHGETSSVAFQESNPNFVVRVGSDGWQGKGIGAYSTDGGLTYTPFAALQDAAFAQKFARGRVAIAAQRDVIVWAAQNAPLMVSFDRGAHWIESQGLPTSLVGGTNIFTYIQPLAADSVTDGYFYCYFQGEVYRSTDFGLTWRVVATLPMLNNTSFARLRTVPNRAGSVWVGLEHHGLFYSHNGAERFESVPDVNVCRLFAFGKGRGQEACLYVYGVVCGQEGIFRSEDFGASWVQIDTPEKRIGNEPNDMAADRQCFGRVYIGSNGNGIYYGEPLP